MMAKKRAPKSKVKGDKSGNATTKKTPSKAKKGASVPSTTDEFASKESSTEEEFIPRGPTLRAEYERRGVIETQLTPNSGVLPEEVANRMLRRIVSFTGVPLTLLFVFFAAYFVLKYKYDITVLPVVVATSTLGAVGLATLGITYGIFSSSWDEEEGSLLGLQEAKENLIRAKDGLMGAREREKREDEQARIDARINKNKD